MIMSDSMTTRISEYVVEAMKAWEVPGSAICVIHDGDTILSSAFGVQDIETDTPTQRETIFWIASNTKAITSFSAALLVDDGLLEWDKPLKEYLPTLRMATPELTENVTISDLLCHRTGIPGTYDWNIFNHIVSRREMYDRLQYVEPSKPFRTTYQYNNMMYALAGYVVETLAGIGWEKFVAERIFQPLGISNFTINYRFPADLPSVSCSFAKMPDGMRHFPVPESWKREVWEPAPAGGVNTNIVEAEKWLRLHLDGGIHAGSPLISKKNLDVMYAPHVAVAAVGQFPELSHPSAGLGWNIGYHRGIRKISHGGALGSYIAFLPDKNIGVAMLTNMGTTLSQAVTGQVFDELLGVEPAPWIERFSEQEKQEQTAMIEYAATVKIAKIEGTDESIAPNELIGRYTHTIGGDIELRLAEDTLEVDGIGTPSSLERYHYDTYVTKMPFPPSEIFMTFSRAANGEVKSMVLRRPDGIESEYLKQS
jgi:CubicO group peptidase (beta-lactamase class C family)